MRVQTTDVVDQHVKPRDGGPYSLGDVLVSADGGVVGTQERHRVGPTVPGEGRGGPLTVDGVSASDEHPGARAGEGTGSLVPDPGGGAGDQRGAAAQRLAVCDVVCGGVHGSPAGEVGGAVGPDSHSLSHQLRSSPS